MDRGAWRETMESQRVGEDFRLNNMCVGGFSFKLRFIYFFLAEPKVTVSALSVVAASRDHSLVAAGGPLTPAISLLWRMGSGASGLSSCGAWA